MERSRDHNRPNAPSQQPLQDLSAAQSLPKPVSLVSSIQQGWLSELPRLAKLNAPAPAPPGCGCGGAFAQIDFQGRSETVRCESCQEVFLVVHDGQGEPAVICLREFDVRRGGGRDQRPLDDHRMAERLMVALAADCWPSPATAVDFGIENTRHFDALQEAARAGVTAYELDRVLGDGQAITELVKATASIPTRDVEFRTPYDAWYAPRHNVEHDSAPDVAPHDRKGNLWLVRPEQDQEPELER